jgi:hypothetical protein
MRMWKRTAPVMGDDIVCSAWEHAANIKVYTVVQPIVMHMTPILEEFLHPKHSGKKLLINITTSIVV